MLVSREVRWVLEDVEGDHWAVWASGIVVPLLDRVLGDVERRAPLRVVDERDLSVGALPGDGLRLVAWVEVEIGTGRREAALWGRARRSSVWGEAVATELALVIVEPVRALEVEPASGWFDDEVPF
jgi:hypothetical protein